LIQLFSVLVECDPGERLCAVLRRYAPRIMLLERL